MTPEQREAIQAFEAEQRKVQEQFDRDFKEFFLGVGVPEDILDETIDRSRRRFG